VVSIHANSFKPRASLVTYSAGAWTSKSFSRYVLKASIDALTLSSFPSPFSHIPFKCLPSVFDTEASSQADITA
jgi:hypothetical protein